MKVMNRREARPEDFSALHQVSQIRQRIMLAGITVTIRIRRRGVIAVGRVPELHFPGGREELPVARVTRRYDAIEHINAAQHTAPEGSRPHGAIQLLALRGAFHGRTDRPAQASAHS